ncbi:MAG: NAD-dependent epimerase/dehydratase family protein [Actinobacteria bacterium]|nr:NAD-dependent epimerase/dehydratase family protein [Actinomycetota bacterium]
MTGATGLIGGQILHDLLEVPQIETVTCLVRPVKDKAGLERLSQRLIKAGLKEGKLKKVMSRVRVAEGEITEKLWGMTEGDLDQLRKETDLLIHCAASTSFVDVASCEAANVDGTRNLLGVIDQAKCLKRLVHFSTATLCGYLPNRIITEDESPNPNHKHVVAYTRTKAEAERILWEQAQDLPLLVLRPSIVMANSLDDPKYARLFLWSLLIMAQLPFIPVKRDSKLDIVTLDFVVKSTMRLIARGDKLAHNCYHLTAGAEASVTAGDVCEVCCKAARLEGPTLIPPDKWHKEHEQTIEEQGLGSLYEALLYLPFINLNLVYDKSRLTNELGKDLPELLRATGYLPRMLHIMSPDVVTLEGLQALGM